MATLDRISRLAVEAWPMVANVLGSVTAIAARRGRIRTIMMGSSEKDLAPE